MGFEADEEILQDFLVEAGEILEHLSEQLVELEQNPDDRELLNAIFRGFHTIKGGAGFLQLEALVVCCHVAENVFDLLRNGALSVSTELMDVVLLALDAINEMFDQVKLREEITPADPEIIAGLESFVNGDQADENDDQADVNAGQTGDASATAAAASAAATSEIVSAEADPSSASATEESTNTAVEEDLSKQNADITDEEFESFLNALDDEDDAQANASGADKKAATAESDDITDDEFEALLDQLHGSGKFDAASVSANPAGKTQTAVVDVAEETGTEVAPSNVDKADTDKGEITDDEFESLLDELHGKGKFGTATAAAIDSQPTDNSQPTIDSKITEHVPTSMPIVANTAATSEVKPTQQDSPKVPVNIASATKANQGGVSNLRSEDNVGKKTIAKPAGKTSRAGPAGRAGGRDAAQTIATETTVRVDTKRLDDIMNMVGELVLVRNRLKRLGEEIATVTMTT